MELKGYDAWLLKGSDYGSDDWELWTQSPYAQASYAQYVSDCRDDHESYLDFDAWLDTPNANEAYDNCDDEPDYEYPNYEDD